MPLPFAGVQNSRSIINVFSLAQVLEKCLTRETVPFEMIPVADGLPLSTSEIISEIYSAFQLRNKLFNFPTQQLSTLLRLTGLEERSAPLLKSLYVDGFEVRRTLNWKPNMTMKTTLQKML